MRGKICPEGGDGGYRQELTQSYNLLTMGSQMPAAFGLCPDASDPAPARQRICWRVDLLCLDPVRKGAAQLSYVK